MSWKMFLDDERWPPGDATEWQICRTFEDAKLHVETNGLPNFISYDHDLGMGPTGYDFAKWLCEHMVDTNQLKYIPYYVHSMNPVGRRNITQYLESFNDTFFKGE